MKQHSVPKFLDNFLTRTLSGTVFSWREILQLTFPNVLDCLSIMFISMLITALISSNGEASVAAVSLVTPLTWMITCIFNGISAGGTVVVAQSCGMKDPVRIRKAAGMTLWLTVAVGTVVCLPLLMFPRQVLILLFPEAEAVVLEKARIYLSGRAWSILVFTIYTANFGILRGLGESGRCLALSVIINAAYLVFSILFLNVLRMDILGSVFALLLARFIGSAASVILLFFWKAPVKMTFGQIFTCDKGILRSTLQVSIPLGLEQVCSSLGNVVAEMYMISLGTTALATHAIANSVIGVWYSPAMAAANLSVTVVGRCFGAEKYDEAKRYGVLFYPIINKVEKTGTVEIMAKARDAKQINRIFERMGYPAPVKEDTAAKKENARAPSENSLKERGTGARASTEPAAEKADARPSVRSRLMALQAAAERDGTAPTKDTVREAIQKAMPTRE